MTDPIKEKLKREKATWKKENDKIKEKLKRERSGFNPNSLVRTEDSQSIENRLYEVGRPVNITEPNIKDLGLVLRRFSEGQKELGIINKLDKSPIVYGTWYSIKKLFGGKRITHSNIYDLFTEQQSNVRDLNYILVSMVAKYGKEVEEIREKLDQTIKSSERLQRERGLLEKKVLPPEIERYNQAQHNLENIDKEKESEKYHAALRELNGARRICRKKRSEYVIAVTGSTHYSQDIENKMLQEDLFETLLYKTAEMAFITELYQKTLDHNLVVWKNTETLAEAVHAVSQGMGELSDFNVQLNNHYIETVRELTNIFDAHPGRRMIDSTNRDLRRLVEDINTRNYLERNRNDR